MAIFDIFSTSFLFSIGIIIILIGGIFAYVSYRMSEQDHKLNSMIGLISIMAEESRFFRSKIAMLQQNLSTSNLPDADKIQYASQMMGGQQELINVSDDEGDYEGDDDQEEETDNDNDNDDDSKQLEEELDEDNDNDDNILISLANDDNHNEMNNVLDIEQLSELKEEIKTVHLENPIVFDETELKEHEFTEVYNETNKDMSFLKNISITNLGEEDTNKPDYKKMSLNKLRDVVVSKGVVDDASKLKKNDLLKLLDDE